MKKRILAWLLFHANKSKDKRFYTIKNSILKKYGIKVDIQVQFIEGKKCFSCHGTGTHIYYTYWTGEEYDRDACWNCSGTAWYKRPVWNWLDIIQFGKYMFHQPYTRTYTEPTESIKVFSGYIEHQETKYTDFALFLLFLAYEKGYLKRWYSETGIGWKHYWWRPRNWIYDLIHIIKHGRNSIPLRKYKKISNLNYNYQTDELPF